MKHKREPRGFYKNISKHKVIIRYAATLLVENGAIDAVKRVQWYQALCLQKPLCHKRCMRTPVENHCPFLTMLKYKPCSWFNWYLKIYQLYKEKVRIFRLSVNKNNSNNNHNNKESIFLRLGISNSKEKETIIFHSSRSRRRHLINCSISFNRYSSPFGYIIVENIQL